MTVCHSCDAWFVWPPPTPEAMLEHYSANRQGMPAELREWRQGTTQNRWYEHLARRIAHHGKASDVTSVVDVGAGGLELTLALADVFPAARVQAWDLFTDGSDQPLPSTAGRRITCRRIDLNRLDRVSPPSERFDVVACVAVIEHVLDPLALLRLLRSITAPGGFAFVVGPEVTSNAHRLLRKAWPYYCPDEHLTLPAMRSIEEALERLGGVSFELRRVNVHYSLRYLLRFLRMPVPLPSMLDFLIPVPAGAFEMVWYNREGRVSGP